MQPTLSSIISICCLIILGFGWNRTANCFATSFTRSTCCIDLRSFIIRTMQACHECGMSKGQSVCRQRSKDDRRKREPTCASSLRSSSIFDRVSLPSSVVSMRLAICWIFIRANGEVKLRLKVKLSVVLTSRDLGALTRMRYLPQAND